MAEHQACEIVIEVLRQRDVAPLCFGTRRLGDERINDTLVIKHVREIIAQAGPGLCPWPANVFVRLRLIIGSLAEAGAEARLESGEDADVMRTVDAVLRKYAEAALELMDRFGVKANKA